jgi:hypothetical protein
MKVEDDSKNTKQEIIRRAMVFPMDKVLFKYRKDKDLSAEVASQHEREIKRFLALTAFSDSDKGMVYEDRLMRFGTLSSFSRKSMNASAGKWRGASFIISQTYPVSSR